MLENNVKAPNLPLFRTDYDRQQFDQFANALRLYFNRLDQYLVSINDAANGGITTGGFTFPHIAASDSMDQRTTDNTATAVKWNTLDSGYFWTLNSPGSATAQVSGVYVIRYSLQFVNTANAIHFATVWLKVNNVDVANSATKFFIPARKSASAGEEGYLCAYSEATFEVEAGEEIELYWATDVANIVSPAQDGVYMFHDAAQVSPFARPAIPSAIGSSMWMSAIT